MDKKLEILALRLREARENLGLKQYEVAEKLGINTRNISSYECGDSLPSVKTLIEFSKLYNTSIDYLLDNDIKISPLINRINSLKPDEQEKIAEIIDYMMWKRNRNKK